MAAAQASRRVHFCFRRASAVSIAPPDRSRSWASIVSVIMLITCSSAKTPCSHWPFANRQTGAETIAL
jgi:hypothetical protein